MGCRMSNGTSMSVPAIRVLSPYGYRSGEVS
ncbi:Uncharacterised protein [Mycobacteroides abscessus subsp. massiliense]|nr:Uncharacterised protein [Mycobacteroides abscessus subsp. massiliense]